jgi:hypothetical protein
MNSRDLYFIRSCVKRQSPVYYRGFSTRGDWVEVVTPSANLLLANVTITSGASKKLPYKLESRT